MPRERVGGPRPFAGEVDDLEKTQHESTRGVIGFLGFLPGVQNALGVSFPTVSKQSKSYSDEMKKAQQEAPSPPRTDRDKWGNLAARKTPSLTEESLAQGSSATSPPRAAQQHGAAADNGRGNSPAVLLSPSPSSHSAHGGEAPTIKVLAGYMGHRPGVRANYGVTFSKEVSER